MQREVEPGRNLLIGQPFRDVVEHFKLAFAERLDEGRVRTIDPAREGLRSNR